MPEKLLVCKPENAITGRTGMNLWKMEIGKAVENQNFQNESCGNRKIKKNGENWKKPEKDPILPTPFLYDKN